jgi:hypothetical protein
MMPYGPRQDLTDSGLVFRPDDKNVIASWSRTVFEESIPGFKKDYPLSGLSAVAPFSVRL